MIVKLSSRVGIVLYSVLVLSVMYGLEPAVADPPIPIASPREGNDSLRAVLKYLWPLFSSATRTSRIYYHAVCPRDDHSYPLTFPKIDVRQPSKTGTDLTVVRSMFRHDPNVAVREDETGVVRIRIGEVPDTILKTRISRLSLDAESQYNVLSAIGAIESAPEVQSVMGKLGISVPTRYYHYRLLQPADDLPHLPAEILNVTMDQALDMIARTWGVIVFYGACAAPATYEVFFADNVYF
jgi:hypothetical protein